MAATQIIDILKRGEEFHKQLAIHYAKMRDAATKEDIRECLDFLSAHEARIGHTLHDYNHDVPSVVRDSWVKPAPVLEAEKLLHELDARGEITLADLGRIAGHLDEAVAQIFRHLAERSMSAEVREALEALTHLEDEERKRLLFGLTAT